MTEHPVLRPTRLLPLENAQDTVVAAKISVTYSAYDERNAASPTKRSFNNNFGTIAVRASLAILAFGGSIGFIKESKTAHAAPHDTTYQIVDGPWYIHATDPTIHSQTVGLAQTGDILTVTCHKTGDNVNGDAEWDQLIDQNNGLEGFVADYGTNTPVQRGQEATQLTDLGIPVCGSNLTNSQSSGNTANILQPAVSPQNGQSISSTNQSGPSAAFFEPVAGMSYVDGLTDNPSVKIVQASKWTAGNCSSANVVAQVPESANTLAGWSNGRLGAVYFLAAATEEQKSRIHTIVMFDPGAISDFEVSENPIKQLYHLFEDGTTKSCDQQYDANALLAHWLESNSQNKLIVITGKDTEMKANDDPKTPSNYTALWKYDFAQIWQDSENSTYPSLRQQVQVCDYNFMEHAQIVTTYGRIVANPPASCPDAVDDHTLTPWNP